MSTRPEWVETTLNTIAQTRADTMGRIDRLQAKAAAERTKTR